MTGMYWKPTRVTTVALLSYGLVVSGLYLAFQVFTTARIAANFITFGPISMALLGVALPVGYLLVLQRRPLADLGITAGHLLPSLALSLLLGWDIYHNTLVELNLTWSRDGPIEHWRKWVQQPYDYTGQVKHVRPFVMVRPTAYPAFLFFLCHLCVKSSSVTSMIVSCVVGI